LKSLDIAKGWKKSLQQLERGESLEKARRQMGDPVGVENPAECFHNKDLKISARDKLFPISNTC
jgi:hypothetical protein